MRAEIAQMAIKLGESFYIRTSIVSKVERVRLASVTLIVKIELVALASFDALVCS